MVGHKDEGVDGATVPSRRLPQPVDVDTVVVVVDEYPPAVVATLDDVNGHGRQEEAPLAGHGGDPWIAVPTL